jgi:hypothetical protein
MLVTLTNAISYVYLTDPIYDVYVRVLECKCTA